MSRTRTHTVARGRRRRALALVAAAAAAVLTLGGCAAGGQAAPTEQPQTLRIGVHGGSTFDVLDPHNLHSGYLGFIAAGLFEGLLADDDDTFDIKYVLAESLEPNADATQWTLVLKDGLTFTDGSPVTIDDVISSYNRVLDPATAATGSSQLALVQSMTKVDARTMTFQMTQPVGRLPELLADGGALAILPQDFDPQNPVGVGPFAFKSFEPGVLSSWTRYDGYHGEPAKVANLELFSLADNEARVNALISGQVDAVTELPAERIVELTAERGFQILDLPNGTARYTAMRVDQGPTADPRVRQAVRLAIDRQQVLDVVFGGRGVIANDLYAPFDPAYSSDLVRTRDLDRARQLVQDAGAVGTELTFTSDLDDEPLMQIYAQNVREIGLQATVDAKESATYWPGYLEYQIGVSEYPSAHVFTVASSLDGPGAALNQTHFSDPEYDELYRQAAAALTEADATAYLHRMQEIQFERGGLIIPVYASALAAATSTTTGWPTDNKGGNAIARSLSKVSFVS